MSKPKLRYEIQTCVIGAGVIGLAVARALVKVGKEVLILERNSNIGAGECVLSVHSESYFRSEFSLFFI